MKKLVLSTLLLAAIAPKSYSQIIVTESVNNAIQQAVAKSVTVKNNLLEQEKSELERKGVLNKYIPKVSATGLYTHFNNDINLDLPATTVPLLNSPLFSESQIFDNSGNLFHAGVSATTVLFSGGQIINGAKALEYKNEGANYLMELDEDAVVKSVIESFDQLALLDAADSLIRKSQARLDKETERVEKAVKNGLAIPYDRDKIKLASLELTSRQKDIQNKRQLLAMKLEQETGISANEILQMSHNVQPIAINESLDISDKTELKALKSYHKASEYLIKKEKGSYLPTVGAFGAYTYSNVFNLNAKTYIPAAGKDVNFEVNKLTLSPNFMVGVALKWEIFSGFERHHNVTKAKISQQQIQNKLTDAEEKLALQLRKNMVNYESMNDQLSVANQRAVIAENNVLLADKQYKAGLISVTDRISAENQIYQEGLNKVQTILNQRKAAMEAFQSSKHLKQSIIVK